MAHGGEGMVQHPADSLHVDPHLAARFSAMRRVLTALDAAGIERGAVLALGLRHAPRAWDVRGIERARHKTHARSGGGRRRGGSCRCLWCRTFERSLLSPEHSACRAACTCERCDVVAKDLVGTALGLYGRMPADIVRVLKRAAKLSRQTGKALRALPDFAIHVRDAGPAQAGKPSLLLDEPRGRRRMMVTHPSDPNALWWPFEGRQTRLLIPELDQAAEALEAFAGTLRQPKGRPVEDAENAWIVSFAQLVRDASAKRGISVPRSWLDDVGSALFELFFGWHMPRREYARVRQRLMKDLQRPRRSRR